MLIEAYVKQRPVPMDRLAGLKAKIKGKTSSGVGKWIQSSVILSEVYRWLSLGKGKRRRVWKIARKI